MLVMLIHFKSKKMIDNVYIIDFSISSTLNVKDLVDYNGFDLFYCLMNLPLSLF